MVPVTYHAVTGSFGAIRCHLLFNTLMMTEVTQRAVLRIHWILDGVAGTLLKKRAS